MKQEIIDRIAHLESLVRDMNNHSRELKKKKFGPEVKIWASQYADTLGYFSKWMRKDLEVIREQMKAEAPQNDAESTPK